DIKATRERLERNVVEVLQTFDRLGVVVSTADRAILDSVATLSDDEAIGAIQHVLDKYVLASVAIDDEAWFTVVPASPDPRARPLVLGQWATYLVKLNSESRVTAPLEVRSLQALEPSEADRSADRECAPRPHDWSHWMLIRMIGAPEMPMNLSGREVEYFAVQLCSLEAGERAAEITFYLGGGQVSQGHYGSAFFLFRPTEAN
ncbi:MAG: hypothetical protein KIT73_18355, partial [Burkholderiales bacterium]|nr:hypothetical protein [Burkholderiales bacterium]